MGRPRPRSGRRPQPSPSAMHPLRGARSRRSQAQPKNPQGLEAERTLNRTRQDAGHRTHPSARYYRIGFLAPPFLAFVHWREQAPPRELLLFEQGFLPRDGAAAKSTRSRWCCPLGARFRCFRQGAARRVSVRCRPGCARLAPSGTESAWVRGAYALRAFDVHETSEGGDSLRFER